MKIVIGGLKYLHSDTHSRYQVMMAIAEKKKLSFFLYLRSTMQL